MRKLAPLEGMKQAVKADVLSLSAWQIGMYGFMAFASLKRSDRRGNGGCCAEYMGQLRGTIGLVQEGRFQLIDDDGVARLVILDRRAALEPANLRALWRANRRVRVRFREAPGLIACIATSVTAVGSNKDRV